MEAERASRSLDWKAMAHFLVGGETAFEIRQRMLLQYERDLNFSLDDYYDMSLEERRQRVVTRVDGIHL